jgi:hypothetical protein
MKHRRLTAAALFVTACLAPAVAGAQDAKLKLVEPLSLKVQRFKGAAPAYRPLTAACGDTLYDTSFRRLGSRPPEEGARRIISVSYSACAEGDYARVTVKLHRGERFYESEELIETFRVRAGEEFRVEKLSGHGIEPYVFSVVKRLRADFHPPRVENMTQSIQVVGVEFNPLVEALKIKLRDVSGRKVMALQIRLRRGGRSLGYMPQLGARGRPVIDTGETGEIVYRLGTGAAPGGASVTETPDTLIVESALFADGGYEGDVRAAATAAAHIAGFRLQLARVVALLDEASAWAETDTRAAATRLLARVEALDSKADGDAVEELKRRFADLEVEQREALRQAVELGMHWLRGELLADVKRLSSGNAPEGRLPKFADWLRDSRAALAERLARQ